MLIGNSPSSCSREVAEAGYGCAGPALLPRFLLWSLRSLHVVSQNLSCSLLLRREVGGAGGAEVVCLAQQSSSCLSVWLRSVDIYHVRN